jgi:hypothetical protein
LRDHYTPFHPPGRIPWDNDEYTKKEENDREHYRSFTQPGDHQSLKRTLPYANIKIGGYEPWHAILLGYSSREITFHSDRLPAISGLATLIANHLNGHYLAGIWWEDVIYGVCWQRDGHLKRPDCYIAPSWSWASVLGKVVFSGGREAVQGVSFKDYRLRHRGRNNFGQVDSGWIKAEAPLASFASMTRQPAGGFTLSRLQGGYHKAWAIFDFEEGNPEDLRLMFLLRDVNKHITNVSGIVLRRVQDSPRLHQEIGSNTGNGQVYNRVGFFYMHETASTRDDLAFESLITEVVII